VKHLVAASEVPEIAPALLWMNGGGTLRRSSQKVGGPAPQWVQIFPYPRYVGELDGEKKTWVTDELSQQSCVDFFNLRGNALAVDYEHLSDKEVEAPAAGRIVELRAGNALGLLARIEWTERARQQIESGEYYYDSPSFFWSRTDNRIYGLRHLALTNNPGSWNRPFITDHTAADYGIERTAQRGGAVSLQLTCAVSSHKTERRGVKSNNVLESLRATLGRKADVTARELRSDLLKLAELVPDADEKILLGDEGAETAAAGESTIAQLVGGSGDVGQRAEDVSSQSTDLSPIALALGVEATNDPRALAMAVMSLRASSVPAERVRDLEQRLANAEAKSGEERVQIEIARQRAAGKQITPAFEAELVRVAKHDLALALSSLTGLQVTSVDLATQSDAPAPTVEQLETARQRATQRTDALPVNASAALKASTSAYEQTLAIANEKGISYADANRLRLDSTRAA
jgi:hypothetical protein